MALIPMTSDATASVISAADPAIDHDASDKRVVPELGLGETPILSYIADRFTQPTSWRQSVRFKDGQTPTVFIIGVIPPSEMNRIDDECDGAGRTREKHWRAFLHGLRDIEDGPTSTVVKDGREVRGVPKITVGGVEYVDRQWLASVFVRGLRSVAIEVGSTVYAWNTLQDTDIKN